MLVNCVAYENGSRLADLPVEEISDYLARPNCFVWVALHDPTPADLDRGLSLYLRAMIALWLALVVLAWM